MSSQLITNYDNSKIFIWNNRYSKGNYNVVNSAYTDLTLAKGTLLGRVSATKKIIPLHSDASDGSQYPVGVLADEFVIPAGSSPDLDLPFCTSGDVVAGRIVLAKSGDTLDTVISGRTIRDRIGSDTVGINLVDSEDLTDFEIQ